VPGLLRVRRTGLPVLEIARKAGVSQGQLSRFMRDERTLTLPVAEKVCRVLGLSLTSAKDRNPKEIK
jgi:transcriptional regulator with XRE-family HTH domain